jgi:hypothetical protein
MPKPSVVVLMIDGISASLPGPYGNTSIDTPAINRLAAESHLFDFCFANSPDLQIQYPLLWPDTEVRPSTIVSDSPEVLQLATDAQFDTIIDASAEKATALADSIAETQAANFLVQALEAIHQAEPGSSCWLHHAGLYGDWDAPFELRCSFADEDDPIPPSTPDRPIGTFDTSIDDPDELLGYQHSAHGQLTAIDRLLEVFLDQIQQTVHGEETIFVFGSTRGYPLGEHGIIGSFDNLYNETIHVPLMVRVPPKQNVFFGRRYPEMIQLSSLQGIIESLGNETGSFDIESIGVPSINSSVGDSKCLQTEAWKLIVENSDIDSSRLYAKPDDRWEVNDVSRRCPDIVDDMFNKIIGASQ